MPLSYRQKTKSFIGGVAVLTVSTAIVKLIGFFYKIPMLRIVGIEGMAYFLAAYHIYTVLFTLSSAALPVSVSILVSKHRANGDDGYSREIFSVSLMTFSTIGLICSVALFCVADKIADLIEINGSAPCIRAVSWALFFVAASSSVKGYFQGIGDMKPTAISQVIESLGKLIFGLIFTFVAKNHDASLPQTAACAALGMTAGVVLSSLYLFIVYFKQRKISAFPQRSSAEKTNTYGIVSDLLKIAFPITMGALVINLTGLADTALISSGLQKVGLSAPCANSVYSSYGNLAVPIFNIVPSFITPIAISSAPLIVEAIQKKDSIKQKELLSTAFRLCVLLSVPASVGVAAFGNEILGIVFFGQTNAISTAAPLLVLLSPAILFSCLITVSNSVLQAYGKAGLPIISMGIGAVLKFTAEYLLVGIENVNISGAPISTVLCDLTVVAINFYFLKKYAGNACPEIKQFYLPCVAAIISGGAISVVYSFVCARNGINSTFAMIPVAAVYVLVYLILSAKTSAISESDIKMIPGGERIYRILKKIRLIK